MRELACDLAWSYIGTPYIWGGDDAHAFDCSGLAVEVLQSVGRFPRNGDATAEDLRQRYPKTIHPAPGDLVFWLLDGKAVHVGIVFNEGTYIAAEGGGSKIKTVDDAWKANAFVKLRPIASRAGETAFANPYGD